MLSKKPDDVDMQQKNAVQALSSQPQIHFFDRPQAGVDTRPAWPGVDCAGRHGGLPLRAAQPGWSETALRAAKISRCGCLPDYTGGLPWPPTPPPRAAQSGCIGQPHALRNLDQGKSASMPREHYPKFIRSASAHRHTLIEQQLTQVMQKSWGKPCRASLLEF